MEQPKLTMAQRIGEVAKLLEKKRSGLVPKSVSVVESDGTLVITLHGVLSPAELHLSRTHAGAAQVKEYHRELFAADSEELRKEIQRITGVEVRQAAAEVEPSTGAVVAVFTTGTIVQVFMLANGIDKEEWNDGKSAAL
jgi:uncharacterized protein YbcI